MGETHVDFIIEIARHWGRWHTPFTICQEISWMLVKEGGKTIKVDGAGLMEVYGIYESQPSFLQDDGIPVELLQLFIPPSLNESIRSEEQWIEWVTRVCHGTQDPKEPFGTLRADSTKHWLRYQVWTGGPSFIGERGHRFNLAAWVDAYKIYQQNPSWLTTVNRFDQAGIAEIALGLGMMNKRLQWEVKKPFGFINADLVGWGLTNNPFFEGDRANKIIELADDPKRSPFRTHIFITISPTANYDRESALVVDACAGPVYGNLTYSQYLEQKALQDGDPILIHGVEHIDPHLIGVDGSDGMRGTSTLKELLHEQYGDIPQEIEKRLTNIRNLFYDQPKVSANFDALKVIDAVFEPALDNRSEKRAIFKQTARKPIATIEGPGVTTYERKAVAVVKDSPTYVSFKVSVFSDGVKAAVRALEARLKLFMVPMDWVGKNKINTKENGTKEDDEILDKRITVFGNVHLSLFVYKNVLVEVSGNAVR